MGTFKYLLPGNVKNKQPKHLLLAFCALLKYIQISVKLCSQETCTCQSSKNLEEVVCSHLGHVYE